MNKQSLNVMNIRQSIQNKVLNFIIYSLANGILRNYLSEEISFVTKVDGYNKLRIALSDFSKSNRNTACNTLFIH